MEIKGQALTELAIFGTILLFCVAMLLQYGLDANYQQEVQMEAFRKAQKIAFYRSGPNATASLALIKDKAIPDPRDQWGFAERYPAVGGGSVTWDNNLGSQYIKEYSEEPKTRDLPALYFAVDKAKSVPAGGAEVPPGAGQSNTFGYYTAKFAKITCSGSITVVYESPTHTPKEYYEETVNCSDIKIMRYDPAEFGSEGSVYTNAKLMYPYYRDSDSLKRRITWADLDGDGKLEQIIAGNADKEFLVIVYHRKGDSGIQLDTDYINAPAFPYGNALNPEDKQGLIPEFKKKIEHTESKIVKTQDGENITSTTELHAKQTITHKFRLNNNQVVEVPVEITPDSSQTYSWR